MTDSEDYSINANLTALPDRVGVDGLEAKWRKVWDEDGTYTFHDPGERKAVYSIDTPPPTVSGHLHVGHVFSYTHTDIIARFKRMNGYEVLYPMGWDDNGLPTERRVQNYYGVRVDTSLKYDPDFVPPFEGTEGKKIQATTRCRSRARISLNCARSSLRRMRSSSRNSGVSWACRSIETDLSHHWRVPAARGPEGIPAQSGTR